MPISKQKLTNTADTCTNCISLQNAFPAPFAARLSTHLYVCPSLPPRAVAGAGGGRLALSLRVRGLPRHQQHVLRRLQEGHRGRLRRRLRRAPRLQTGGRVSRRGEGGFGNV